LENLENTCYINASVQCLNAVPELRQVLNSYSQNPNDSNARVVGTVKNLFNDLNTKHSTVVPLGFVMTFRETFPNFGEQRNGKYMQQDAEEFWSQLLNCLRILPKLSNSEHVPGANVIDQLFDFKLKEEYTCLDNQDEPKSIVTSTVKKISCNIQLTTNFKDMAKDIYTAFEQSYTEKINKLSPTLNREASYNKKSLFDSLPYYATVQFVRFWWKQTDEKGHKTKISRPIDFPFVLDLYKFCTPELQAKLLPHRKQEKKDSAPATSSSTSSSLGPYINKTGQYELIAVLTHQGMSSDGGHYVGWVRQSVDQDDWLEFNDKKVEKRTFIDIQKLTGQGGAQWHIAYMCLYKSKEKAE